MKILDDLADRIFKRYPYPQPWWSKVQYKKRCTEIYVAQQALLRCIDRVFTDNPADIINDYIFELEICKVKNDNERVDADLNIMINTLNELVLYLEAKEK
jgi:hypothetical protein